jgi:hypothetical protein
MKNIIMIERNMNEIIMDKIKMVKKLWQNQPWLNQHIFKLIMGILIMVKFIKVK